MKRIAVTLLIATCMAAVALAADKPDFSGEWRMNPAASRFGLIPPPATLVRKIEQSASRLVIREHQTGAGLDLIPAKAFELDGTPAVLRINGAEVKGSATWNQADIVVNTAIDAASLTFTDTMSLSQDGKQLTSRVHIESGEGAVDIVLVFDRQ